MDKTKIRLSQKEAELVVNADWILRKNHILQKVKYILEELQSEQYNFLHTHNSLLPAEVMAISPKISKGENYKGLPYLVLDYPRFFDKNDHMAIRCMFWWGNFFSITLHLSGIYKSKYEQRIAAAFKELEQGDFFVSASDEQWQHHFEESNYLPINKMTDDEFRKYAGAWGFIKLAKKIPLEHWDDASDILFASFSKMIGWLAD